MGDEIKKTFFEKYGKIFEKVNPNWGEVKAIFNWLKNEGIYAKYFGDIENLDELRRETEAHFSQFKKMRKEVDEESQRVNKELKKRDEELRQIHTMKKGKFGSLSGESEVDRIPPPQ